MAGDHVEDLFAYLDTYRKRDRGRNHKAKTRIRVLFVIFKHFLYELYMYNYGKEN